jgi:hypothetical protein
MTRGQYLLPRFIKARRASAGGEIMRSCFEEEVERLFSYTLPQAGNLVHRNRLVKAAVFGMLKTASSLTTRVGLKGFRRNPFYKYYYLNGLHEPFFRPFWEIQFPKNRSFSALLIKEVHLLRSYNSFRAMYPDGKVIFLIRNPVRQVASERKNHGYKDGDRPESRSPEHAKAFEQRRKRGIAQMQDIYGESELIRKNYGMSFEQTFSLFWRLENDAIARMMDQESSDHFLALKYEDLVADNRAAIEMILGFLDLEVSENLERYLQVLSNYRGKQRHGRSTFVSQDSLNRRSNSALENERAARVSKVVSGSIAADRFGYG